MADGGGWMGGKVRLGEEGLKEMKREGSGWYLSEPRVVHHSRVGHSLWTNLTARGKVKRMEARYGDLPTGVLSTC